MICTIKIRLFCQLCYRSEVYQSSLFWLNNSGGRLCHERERIFINARTVAGKVVKRLEQRNTARFTGKLTVKELFEEWLSAVRLKVKESTYANYRMKADKHILPEFGGLRYENLTVQMLHNFIENKLKIGLSAKYVSDIVIVFKSMAKYISRVHGFKNPIADVILPKTEKYQRIWNLWIFLKFLCF